MDPPISFMPPSWRRGTVRGTLVSDMIARLTRVLSLVFVFAACGSPEVTVVNPLTAVNWSPHDGAAGIDVDAEPSVCLSLRIDQGSLAENVSLRRGDYEPGAIPETEVDASIELSTGDDACIVFRQPDLQYGTTYHMVLEPGLESLDSVELGVRLSSRFTTAEEDE